MGSLTDQLLPAEHSANHNSRRCELTIIHAVFHCILYRYVVSCDRHVLLPAALCTTSITGTRRRRLAAGHLTDQVHERYTLELRKQNGQTLSACTSSSSRRRREKKNRFGIYIYASECV